MRLRNKVLVELVTNGAFKMRDRRERELLSNARPDRSVPTSVVQLPVQHAWGVEILSNIESLTGRPAERILDKSVFSLKSDRLGNRSVACNVSDSDFPSSLI